MTNLSIKAMIFQESSNLNKLFGIVKNSPNPSDFINLGVGDPFFPTPDEVKIAGIKAIEENQTGYTPATGTISLKRAISSFLKTEGLIYDTDEIAVSTGSKVLIPAILSLICNEEIDSAIIPAPYYPPFLSAVNFSCSSVITIDTQADDFQLTGETLEREIINSSLRPKVLIINSPNNPTGAVYTKENLLSVAKIVAKYNLFVISDECYESYVFPGNKFFSISQAPGMKERTVIIRSFSKKYNMCGWRIGFVAGPKKLVSVLSNYLGELVGCPSSISQIAAEAALRTKKGELKTPRKVYLENKKIIEAWLKKKGLNHSPIQGAFYVFVDFSPFLGVKLADSVSLSFHLLDKTKVIVAPGIDFGRSYSNYIRISLCSSSDHLKLALERFDTLFE